MRVNTSRRLRAKPLDVRAFTATVSARRGRPIHLLPKTARIGPCGVWLAMPSADYVFFENATSPLHREHIILHELGHLLRDHAPTEVIDDRALRLLLPSLDIEVVRRVMGRTNYTAVEEQEAEMIASLLLSAALSPRWAIRVSSMVDNAVLATALLWLAVIYEAVGLTQQRSNRARRALLLTFVALALAATFFAPSVTWRRKTSLGYRTWPM